MANPSWAKYERAELCDALEQVGPDAPTLCGTWTTRDLAAHLVVRERRPDTMPGILLPGFNRWTERVQDRAAERDYADLISDIRSGPPLLSPFSLPKMDELMNTAEYFVHHEDIRRAQPDWQPRELNPKEADACWSLLKKQASMLYRHVPVGVLLVRTDSDRAPLPRVTAHKAQPQVKVAGPAAELLLFSFGRRDQSKVELSGDEAAIKALTQSDMSV